MKRAASEIVSQNLLITGRLSRLSVPKVRTSDGSERVSRGFSPDSEHLGQDVRADAGTLSDPEPVRAEARTHLFSDRTFLLH